MLTNWRIHDLDICINAWVGGGGIFSFKVCDIENKCELLWTCDKLKWTYHNSAKFKGELAN